MSNLFYFVTNFQYNFQQVLRRITKRQLAILSQDAQAEWSGIDPKDESELPNLENEVCVAGIYLRLLVANPGWVLRKPKETVGELVEASLQALQKEEVNNCSNIYYSCGNLFILKYKFIFIFMHSGNSKIKIDNFRSVWTLALSTSFDGTHSSFGSASSHFAHFINFE